MHKQYWGDITAIGSLPDIGTQEGLQLVLQSLPRIPHWPQFPKRPQEYLTHQFLQVLIEHDIMEVSPNGSPLINTERPQFIEGLTAFYETYLEATGGNSAALEKFAIPQWAGEGFAALIKELKKNSYVKPVYVKGQLVGPLTAGLQIMDNNMIPVFYDDQLRDVVLKALTMNIRWQVKQLASTGLPVMIFLDEGLLHAYGHRDFLGISAKMITNAFSELITAIKDNGAEAGVHFCSRADWELLFPARPDILAFDAYSYFSGMLAAADKVDVFLAEGGTIAWGLIPSYEACFNETAAGLCQRWQDYIKRLEEKGVDGERLRTQYLITPSCGTGFYTPEIARRVYRLLRETGELIDKTRFAF
ncbi:MAG: hypothetical protein GX893_01755 [Firmicutes bacterium]|nr:hypothetical protein [Bacillota bacterium]